MIIHCPVEINSILAWHIEHIILQEFIEVLFAQLSDVLINIILPHLILSFDLWRRVLVIIDVDFVILYIHVSYPFIHNLLLLPYQSLFSFHLLSLPLLSHSLLPIPFNLLLQFITHLTILGSLLRMWSLHNLLIHHLHMRIDILNRLIQLKFNPLGIIPLILSIILFISCILINTVRSI